MITQFLHRISNWKFILPIFILFVANSYMFTYYQNKIDAIAGESVPILDMRDGGYTFDEAKTDFEKMKPEGRSIYQFLASKVDMIYPITYGLFYMAVLSFFIKKITDNKWVLLLVAFAIPLLSMGVDYFENFNNLKLLNQFPNIVPADVERGNTLTGLKFNMTFFTMFLVILSFTVWTVKSIWRKKKA